MSGETPVMKTDPSAPILLQRVDPSRNMARFYRLSVESTLFGWGSVVRTWGRIGTSGRSKIDLFDTVADGEAAMGRIERIKRQRGYIEPR